MVEISDYIAENGVSIRWGRLLTVIFGAGVFAYFQGTISAFLSLVNVPLELLSGLTEFAATAVGVVYDLPAVVINRGFAAAVPYVADAGLAGYVVALTIVLATLYPIAWVVSRVR
ncbi:hypothetical protein [Haloarcula sp. JP-L23]|uniref:hypothetical protein n=1 Tax=Haloarcula sp. JP-L23 TaxID=2716717 RepID=UPI00140ECBFA|nr:hypothetical protein G9465_12310 [Haloarcula sp. JP-L23]